MKANSVCINCLYAQQYERVKARPEEEKKTEFLAEVMRLLAEGVAAGRTAPVMYAQLQTAHDRIFEVKNSFRETKSHFNRLMMAQEEALRARIAQAEDPLQTALCLARAGNYIDFTVGGSGPDEGVLTQLLRKADEQKLDEVEYRNLRADLEKAERMVYLTDNCGEVVLDRLAIEQLQAAYPALQVTVLVRGQEAANDATMEDARECGLCETARCVGNGSGVTGTSLPDISEEARGLLYEADVLISKGQGNFETLHDSGLNIYYLFLSKCERFMNLFHVPRNTGMLVNELRAGSAR